MSFEVLDLISNEKKAAKRATLLRRWGWISAIVIWVTLVSWPWNWFFVVIGAHYAAGSFTRYPAGLLGWPSGGDTVDREAEIIEELSRSCENLHPSSEDLRVIGGKHLPNMIGQSRLGSPHDMPPTGSRPAGDKA